MKIVDSARCAPGHDRLPHPKHASRGSGCCFSPRNLPGLNTSGSGYVSGSDSINLHQTFHVGEISIEYHSRQATNHTFASSHVPLGIEYPSWILSCVVICNTSITCTPVRPEIDTDEDTYPSEPPRATEGVLYRSHSRTEVNHGPERSEVSRARRRHLLPPAPVSEYLGLLSWQGRTQTLWWVSVTALFNAILACKKINSRCLIRLINHGIKLM